MSYRSTIEDSDLEIKAYYQVGQDKFTSMQDAKDHKMYLEIARHVQDDNDCPYFSKDDVIKLLKSIRKNWFILPIEDGNLENGKLR